MVGNFLNENVRLNHQISGTLENRCSIIAEQQIVICVGRIIKTLETGRQCQIKSKRKVLAK